MTFPAPNNLVVIGVRVDPRKLQFYTGTVQDFVNNVHISGEEVQADCRQTGNGQMQSSETEGRSGYRGRDEETWSGAEGMSGNRRSVRNRVLGSSA